MVRIAFFMLVISSAALAEDFRRTVASSSGSSVVCVSWTRRELTYRIDVAGSEKTPVDSEFTAIEAAFSSWQILSDRCSDFRLIRGERITKPTIGKGTEVDNVLTFREKFCRDVVANADPCFTDSTCGNKYFCWDHSDGTIGLTTLTYSTKSGVILDADIEFNAAGFNMTTISSPPCEPGQENGLCAAYDVQNTATHEIGHVIGLDHVDNPSSTMAATASVGEIGKRVIDPGTAEGFCLTYPKAQPTRSCDELASIPRKIKGTTIGCNTAFTEPSVYWLLGLVTAGRLLDFRRHRFAGSSRS